MSACCAYGCTNRQMKNKDVSFHRFPENEAKRALWIKAVRRENWLPTKYTRICSAHFASDLIDRSMTRVVLKEHAVPTIFTAHPSYLQKIVNTTPSCEMGTKTDPLSDDIASHNEGDFFTKHPTEQIESENVSNSNFCESYIKTEIDEQTLVSDFGSQNEHSTEQMECETVTGSNFSGVYIKTEIEEQPVISDFASQDEKEVFLEVPVMKDEKYNSGNETDIKTEIKEEPHWLGAEPSSVSDGIKDGKFLPVTSPRLCSQVVSGANSGKLPLPSAEHPGKGISFYDGKELHECESQATDITGIPTVEGRIHLEQTDKYNESREIYCRASCLKPNHVISESKKPQKCSICEKRFTSLSELKSHNVIHKGKKPYKCVTCEKRYTHLSSLKIHNFTHEGKRPHKCKICDKSFTKLSTLKRHSLVHEGKKPYKCEICDKSFTQLSTLKRHSLVHEGKKPYKCEICDKSFAQISNLKSHILIHEGKKPYMCEICIKSFTQLSNLKTHNLIHEGKKPHKCKICNKEFTQLSNFQTHYMIHEGKQPHKCEICDKRFTHLSSFKIHNLIHEGKKPHKCKVCDKSFTQVSNLHTHNLMHEGKQPHKCQMCDKRFTHLSSLRRHNLIHGGK